MKYLLTFLFFLSFIALNAQVQFSIVCNNSQNKLEVIIKGNEQAHHTVLKDDFPNQRVAEKYLNDNKANLLCGPRPAVVTPPPTTADRSPTRTNSSSAGTAGTTTIRKGAKYYDRHFMIKGSVSKLFSLDKIYLDNVESGKQSLGYDLGAELFYGKAIKGGVGFHYTSIYGGMESLLLDVVDDFPEFYGSLKAFRGEAFIRSPIRAGKDTWVIFDFGFSYYFNVKTTLETEYDEILIPQINDQLYSIRWGLGADYKGVNLFVDGEIIYGFSDDIDKESFFRLKGGLGYAF